MKLKLVIREHLLGGGYYDPKQGEYVDPRIGRCYAVLLDDQERIRSISYPMSRGEAGNIEATSEIAWQGPGAVGEARTWSWFHVRVVAQDYTPPKDT
jgi:hypothetical protein